MSLPTRFGAQPRVLLMVEALVMTGAVGYLDYATGWELSLFVFYAVPILVSVWCIGRVEGILLATVSAAIWWVANSSVHPYKTAWGFNIAVFSRFAYFVFVAVGGAALKAQRKSDLLRITALEKTRALEGEIVRVSEEEQRRIGRDLHDGLCQFLAAINFSAKSLADDLEQQGASRAREAREIEELLHEAITQARSLARGLFPVQMDGGGLSVALDDMAATTQRLTSVRVTFSESGDTQVADRLVATQLYRIAQEALSNAIKHGNVTEVKLSLTREGDSMILSVRDNGRGFIPHASNGSGMGLGTMSYRANSIEAKLEIKSDEKTGTAVTCRVPVGTATPESIHS